ncbi:Lys14p [Saccharomyces cerevisiae YJM1450]|nr:Lys14p [Saccharomyces cerevisiae YJM1450]CAI4331193.1 BDN_1c_G0008920.mRNA.1.CDS.1 [Saccharomyces cerevisiae]CAI7069580.1 BDN_1c_G0008920.mRNA.1.CDS.1 [Saccharomyces cerevisiae]
MFESVNLDENSPEDRELAKVLSPPGSYLSPASLDSGSSFTNSGTSTSCFEPKNNLPSLSFLNARAGSLGGIFNHKQMTSPSNSNIGGENVESTTSSNDGSNENAGHPTTSEQDQNADHPTISQADDNGHSSLTPNPAVTSTVTDKKGKTVKRKYSRNGCSECKRRRMKCDETKPTCWQCARLNRQCVYVLNPKNKKRRTSNAQRVKEFRKHSTSLDNDHNNARKRQHSSCKAEKKKKVRQNLSEDTTDPKPITDNGKNVPLDEIESLEIPNLDLTTTMNGYDVNLLMQNLNDMVNMKLHDSYLLNEELKGLDLPDLDIPELLPASNVNSSVPISFLVNNVITFNTKLSSFKLGGIHDKYLKIFYYDCLDSIAPFFQNQGNPLRDILLSFAKNEAYLLSSILATGASIAYRKSNNLEDERNYCAYLSHCLSLLGEQFKNESNVLNRIEPIILTVIMLAWDCIYSMNSQWRSHLKGVTDLFKKINAGNSSKVLNVAKCWFKVMETFASISTVFGGSLIDNSDLDAIFDPYDYQYVDSLKFLNIMTPLNEFNLLRGHKEDFDLVIKEVFKSLNTIRSTEKNYFSKEEGLFTKKLDYLLLSSQTSSEKSKDQISYFNTQKILVEIDKQLDYEFIDKSGIIPSDNQSHPRISNIHDNAIDMVTLKNGEEVAISWYDISHQTQVLSFLLIVLLKLLGMPKESSTIQQVVKKIMSFFKFLDSDSPPQNSRTCYSNFAVLIAGLNAMDEETRAIVKRYYKINGGKFQRLTEHNLNRLEKVWYGKNQNYRLEEQDVLTW